MESRTEDRAAFSVQSSPDENHMSVYPGALGRGLSAVFGDTRDWARALDK